MAQMNLTEVLARGMRQEFVETYARDIKSASEMLGSVMELGLKSDKFSELHGYIESTPYWQRWARGEEIPRDAMRSRSFIVPNVDWGIAIDWHENDEADDQSRSVMTRVREAASDAATLPERVFYQMLQGTVDPTLLAAVPTAPDGGAFFATTAGGSNRFGVSSGNLLTGNGIGSVAAIHQDLYAALAQYILFQDTKGKPLWRQDRINQGVVIIYGAGNLQVFQQAFYQLFPQGNSAAPSNIIRDSKIKFELWSTPYITTNDWFVFLKGAPRKAVFQQTRQEPKDNLEDMTNSDYSRRTGNRAMQWKARYGFGMSIPYQAMKIDN